MTEYTFYDIIKIIFIIILFFIVYTIQLNSQWKDKIRRNWNIYKCKPYIIPIAGLFRQDNEKKGFLEFTIDNFKKCSWIQSKTFFGYLIRPIQYILNIIINIIEDFRKTLNVFRAEAKGLREMFKNIVIKVAEKMEKSYAAVLYYQNKMKDILKQQMAIFSLLMYFVDSMKMTIESLINGPIIDLVKFFPVFGIALLVLIVICTLCMFGGPFTKLVACPICLVCFSGESKCVLKNNEIQSMKNIKIGDYLQKGERVTSTFVFDIRDRKCDMYVYNGIWVSGSHIIIGDVIDRADKHPLCKKGAFKEDKIYCLNTEKRFISLQDKQNKIHTFSDFFENSNKKQNTYHQYLIETILNPSLSIEYTDNDNDYEWGMYGSTLIHMRDGSLKPISDIELGDVLYPNQKVYGLVKHSTKTIDLYEYKGIIVSGTLLVREGNIWLRIYQSKYSKLVKPLNKEKILYHIVCDGHKCVLDNNIITRDYLEIEEDHPIWENILKRNLHSVKSI